MDFNELKHQEAFNNWFPNDFAGKSSYITGLKSIQKKLNCDIDSLLEDGLKPAINKLTPELFDNNKKLSGNAVSHLKKYHNFYQEKINKFPFRRRKDFEKWLPGNGVKSTSSYVAHINSIQQKLKVDIDELLSTGLDTAVKQINPTNFEVGARTLSDKRCILKKYNKFLESLSK